MPTTPPRQNKDKIDDTIDPNNEVDEASLESFPASDAPAFTSGSTGAADYERKAGDDPTENPPKGAAGAGAP